MLFPAQEPEHSQLFEHFGESQHAQTTEAVLQAGLLPAQERRKGHFAKVAGRLKKSFRRPTCHAYDYAALIVPTAVCICIGMHAVKRRNRTHEIHNLHKTHRPIFFLHFVRQEPQGVRPEHSFSCLSILAKANMLKQLKLCFRPGSCLRRSDGKGILQRSQAV